MEIITSYLGEILVLIATGFTTWFFARKKNQQEVNSLELENVDKSLAIYRKMIDDITNQKESLNDQYQGILENHKKLLADHKQIMNEVMSLKKIIEKLTRENKHLSELIEAKEHAK